MAPSQAELANGIANGANSTSQHVSAPAGRSNWTRQHQMSVNGPVSTGQHVGLAATDQEVRGSNPFGRTAKALTASRTCGTCLQVQRGC